MPEVPQDDSTGSRSFLKQYGKRLATLSIGIAVVAVVAVVAGVVSFNAARGTAEPRTVDAIDATPAAQVDFTKPFVGTPAASWADGETGVTVPQAKAVGVFTAQQVTDAYAKVRQAVVTSRLDRSVLENHDIERYLTLLAKDSQKKMRPVFANDPREAHAYATRVDKGFKLLPVAPKVSGRMWAEQGKRDGELLVHTNYVFAYAFATDAPDKLKNVMDIVTVDRWDVDYSVLTGKYTPSSLGIWPSSSRGFTYSMGCKALRAGYLAPAYSERRTDAAAPTQGTYFDPGATLPDSVTCD